jgi:CBS domain-containing protein
MTVQDIMTREVVSCQKSTDIGTAARLMLQGRFGSLPVVDQHGKVAGIVTDRDIALAAATRQRNASHIAVHEAMSPRVQTCSPQDEVGVALKQMEEARVRRLPVLDASGHLAGILSIDDVVLRAVDKKDGIAPADFVTAMRLLCSRPTVEPEVDLLEPLTPG